MNIQTGRSSKTNVHYIKFSEGDRELTFWVSLHNLEALTNFLVHLGIMASGGESIANALHLRIDNESNEIIVTEETKEILGDLHL